MKVFSPVGVLCVFLSLPAYAADPLPPDPFAQPAGSRAMFRDDELALVQWSHNDGRDSITRLQFNGDYTLNGESVKNSTRRSTYVPESYSRHGMAAGRVTRQEVDQLLTIQKVQTAEHLGAKTDIVWWISDRLEEKQFRPLTWTQSVEPRGYEQFQRGALAIADLDNLPDSDGNAHDEVIAVTETKDSKLEVRVFNYAMEPGNPIVTTLTLTPKYAYMHDLWYTVSGRTTPHTPGPIAVCAADLDGSGKRQIVVVFHENVGGQDDHRLIAVVCDYESDGKTKTAKLTQREIVEVMRPAPVNGGIEVTHGDFLGPTGERKTSAGAIAGGGREQVAIAFHGFIKAARQYGSEVTIADVIVAFLDREPLTKPNPVLETKTHWVPFDVNNFQDSGTREPALFVQGDWRRQWLGLASGLFKLDPLRGHTLGRRQVALSYPVLGGDAHDSFTFVQLWALDVSAASPGVDAQGQSLPGNWSVGVFGQNRTPDTRSTIWDSHLAAGNLCGSKQNPPSPLWTLMLLVTANHGGSAITSVSCVTLLRFDGDNMVIVNPGYLAVTPYEGHVAQFDHGSNPAVVMVPYDALGRSMVLGAPIHLTLEDLVSTDYILQEPPKHIDYLPFDERGTARGIVNISVDPNFNIGYADASQKEITNDVKTTSGKTYGNSEELSVSASLTLGVSKVLSKTVSLEDKLKFSYAYNEKTENFNKSSEGKTETVTAATNAEDALSVRVETIEIYRYPLYGLKKEDAKMSYFDVSFPRVSTAQRAGGSQWPDSYQPKHQNGNALTYPILQSTFIPTDMGSFSGSGPAPLTTPAILSWNGNQETSSIAWSQSTSTGKTIDWSKTLSASNDLTGTYKVSGTGAILGGDLKVSMTTSNSGSSSWGEQTTRTTTSKRNQELILRKTAGESTRGYTFMPLFYVTKDGTLKMASATDFTHGIGADWWKKTYAAPDAALNLPYRFLVGSATAGGPDFNLQDNAKLIRGARAYLAKRDGTGEPIPISGPAPSGEKFILETRVYNLSLATPLGLDENGARKPVNVRFDAVPYDSEHGIEFGERKTLGMATVKFADGNLADPGKSSDLPPIGGPVIPPRGIGLATSGEIDPKSLPPVAGTRRDYHIYAVVDPDNEIRWKPLSGKVAEQTHVWHRPELTIRVKNAQGVIVTLQMQDEQGKPLETISTVSGTGVASMTAELLQMLKETKTFKDNDLQAAADASSGIIVSHRTGKHRIKPSKESRSGIVIDDGTPAGKAIYFVPSVKGDSRATIANTIVVTNDAPAQNKEGYFNLAVMAPAAARADTKRLLSLPPLAVAAIDSTGRLSEKSAALTSGQPASLRVTVNAAEDVSDAVHVLLYLGDPKQNGTFLGMLTAAGIDAGTPTHTWAVLPMPDVAGDYPVYAQIAGEEARPGGLILHLTR